MRDYSKYDFSTVAIRAGWWDGDPVNGAVSPPIYQTTNFVFHDVADGARKCESVHNGYCYTRLGNPTLSVLEERIAALEGAEAGLAFATGVAAITALLTELVKPGDHIVCSNSVYSATNYFMSEILAKFGVETTFVDAANLEAVEAATKGNTRIIYAETPANPTIKVIDLEGIGRLARDKGAMVLVDSTFATPYLLNPLKFEGITAVIHSGTKYIGGHGDAMAGLVVGSAKLMDRIRDTSMKNMGGILGPFEAWLLLRGLKTLAVRMDRHCSNAMKVAEFLEQHPKVERVFYPGLPSHPQHEVAKKQMRGFGGMLSFELKSGIEAGVTLMNNLKICRLAVSLGDIDTLVQHPASMTHWYVEREERLKAEITDGLVRMSVGLEGVNDIISDLEETLALV